MTAAKQLSWLDMLEPTPEPTQAELRDETLERHQKMRPQAIAAAIAAGLALCERNGGFTASEIPDEMRRQGNGYLLADKKERRWIGGAILQSNGFRNTGEYLANGSKGRKQPRWVKA